MEEKIHQRAMKELVLLYFSIYPDMEQIATNITFTDDLNETNAILRPDKAEWLLAENPQNDYNGRMVLPNSLEEPIHILVNLKKVDQYTKDGSMTWIGTIGHELTHAIDYYQMARLEELSSYLSLEDSSHLMFRMWSEYHAKKCGYRFLRKYFELSGSMPADDDIIMHILRTELPQQTDLFNKAYNASFPYERLYLTMQYLGRFSVWIDLYPTHFSESKVLDACPGQFWMLDLLAFLRKHETLKNVYGKFDELQNVLKENWIF